MTKQLFFPIFLVTCMLSPFAFAGPKSMTDAFTSDGASNANSSKVCIKTVLKPCLVGKQRYCDGLDMNGWKQCEAKTHSESVRLCSAKGIFGYCLAYRTSSSSGRMICSKPVKKFRKKCKWKCRKCSQYAHIRRQVCVDYEVKCNKASKNCSYPMSSSFKCEKWGPAFCHKRKLKCVRFQNGVCKKVELVCAEKRRTCLKNPPGKLVICSQKDLGCLSHSYSCKKKGVIYVKK